MGINEKQLFKMPESVLSDYVRDRLLQKRMDPPWAWQHDEEPEDFIIRACKQAKPDFLDRFDRVITTLLADTDVNPKTGEYFSCLLYLSEFRQSNIFLPVLKKCWADREKFKGIPSHHTRPDLLVHLIRVIIQYKDPELGDDLKAYLDNSAYAPAAYRGIIDLNQNPVEYLGRFVDTMRKAKEEIWIKTALETLSHVRGASKVLDEWISIKARVESANTELVLKYLKALPAYQGTVIATLEPASSPKCPPVAVPGPWSIKNPKAKICQLSRRLS